MTEGYMEQTITELEEYITEYEDMTADARELSERDRDYYDHIQLTTEEIAALQARKQPTGIYNRIRPKINTLIGMEQQSRTDPKAEPRTPKHEEDAQTATEAIRYVIDNNNFDDTSSDCFLNLCVEGTPAVDVFVKKKKDDYEIQIKNIPWDRFIYDPHSRCPHFSDARYLGVAIWMDYDEAQETYPDKIDEVASDYFSGSDTLDDKPNYFTDKKRKRVRIFQLYYKQGATWYYAEFCKGTILAGGDVSPYLDEDDEPSCPIIACSANVDRNGNRFGEVRAYVGQQDEINKRRNKALHLLSQRQTFSSKGAVSPDKVAALKRELAKPDGHLEFVDGEFGKEFGVLPTADMASGNLALLQDAKQEIDMQGANAALSGKLEGNPSGRAVQARQQGGQLETTPLLDRHVQFKKRVYRAVWERIAQFWKKERWIRVTDNNQQTSWIGLNQPITRGMVMQQQGQVIPPSMQNHPMMQEVLGYQNQVSELDVDIIIDQSPDVVTLQHEQFEQLVQLYQANPQAIPFDLIIEASSLKNKSELVKAMRGEDEKGKQLQQQKQQEMAQQKELQMQAVQLDMADKQADVQKKQSEATKNVAQVKKTQAETQKVAVDTASKYHLGQ